VQGGFIRTDHMVVSSAEKGASVVCELRHGQISFDFCLGESDQIESQ